MPSPLSKVRQLAKKVRDVRADHQARHRSTGHRFVIADDVRFLHAADWDAVARNGGFFMSREYLRVLADHGPENVSPRCALVYSGLKPVAAIAAQIVTVQGRRVVKPGKKAKDGASLLKRALLPIGKSAVARMEERVLVCGNLLSWGRHGVAFADGVDTASLWPAVAEALYRIRRGEKLMGDAALMVIKDLSPEDLPAAELLKRYGYRAAKTDPDMVLTFDPKWRSYDDYLASLDGKYRKSARQIFADAAAAGVTFEQLDHMESHAERLHELYLEVHEMAAVRPFTLPVGFLPALAAGVGPALRCTVARRGGQIVGFVTTLKDGDTAIGYYIGFDRSVAAEGAPLYLGLLHGTIRDALALGCRRLSLGRTALEPKARLGAKPVPLHLWTRHRSAALNVLLRGLLNSVPHDEAPERNPFKKADASAPNRPAR